MELTKRYSYSDDWLALLVGQTIDTVTDDTLTLSDGTRLTFDKSDSDCCSFIELTRLTTVPHIITSATLKDNEDETGGEGAYKAWLHVITEAGEFNAVEADGDASNGYYLHGFALGVTATFPTAGA